MTTCDDDPVHAPINARLADLVAGLPTVPAWHDAWSALGPESTEEARLAVYQAVRDSGCLPEEAGFYLVAWQVDALASIEADVRFAHLDDQMKAIEESHGLGEGELWPRGKSPPEYEKLRQEYEAAWDDVFVDKLEQHGEREMARLFREDREEFERQHGVGRVFFHGAEDVDDFDAPDWVYDLVEAVASCTEASGAPGPLGFMYQEEEGFWEIAVYPKSVELIGGPDDGAVVSPGFSIDMEGLRAEFDRVVAMTWNSLGYPCGEGPYVAIEGIYQGHEVFLQVLAYPPEDEEPGMKLDASPPPTPE